MDVAGVLHRKLKSRIDILFQNLFVEIVRLNLDLYNTRDMLQTLIG